VDGETLGEIGPGLLILVCAMQGDDDRSPASGREARQAPHLQGRGGQDEPLAPGHRRRALVVSQFTLAADLRGNRPGFSTAAPPAEGERLYEMFARSWQAGIPTARAASGADKKVSLVNDAPSRSGRGLSLPPPASALMA
jgi:D-tyrosyl-tRNA(Tyr) deacylase